MIDGTNTLKETERKLILDKVNKLRDMHKDLGEILANAKAGKDEFKDPSNRPDNVYFICPDIKQDYFVLSNNELPFLEFIQCFEMWTIKVRLAIMLNRHLLKNKAIMKHMEEMLDVCMVIDHATRALFPDDHPDDDGDDGA